MRLNKVFNKTEPPQPSTEVAQRKWYDRRKIILLASVLVMLVVAAVLGTLLIGSSNINQRDANDDGDDIEVSSLEGRDFEPDTTRSQLGTIKAVNDDTLVLDTDGADDLELAITEETEYYDGYTIHEADPADLTVGSSVDVTYNFETNEAISVWVQ